MPDDPRASFGPIAANYSRAKFHTSSDRLQEVIDLVRPLKGDLVLDVATGTGNTAFALAPLVRRGGGLALTRGAPEVARRVAGGRGVRHADSGGPAGGRRPPAPQDVARQLGRGRPH